MIALGGGAVGTDADPRRRSRERALTVLVEVDAEEAWRGVGGSDRPLAQDEAAFRTLYEQRRRSTTSVADARARDVDGAVLAAGGVHVEPGALERLGELVPGDGPGRARHRRARRRDLRRGRPARARRARSRRSHELPPGEQAKTRRVAGAALARARARPRRARSSRSAAAARPTSPGSSPRRISAGRLGRRADDARRPGRRGDRRQDGDRPPGREEPRRRLPLAGADGDRPRAARDAARARSGANGLAEVVEDGPARGRAALGAAGRASWSAAPRAFKAALCLRDPHDRGERAHPQPRPHVRARARGGGGLRARRTATPSRSACSPRCGSPGLDDDGRRGGCCGRSRFGSTATRPGRRSRATRRSSAARRGSCCSTAPGQPRTSASSVPRGRRASARSTS